MDMREIDLKILIIALIICLGGGMLSGLISGTYGDYTSFARPDFYPPGWVFTVVWTVLYILMAVSFAMVYSCADRDELKIPFTLFALQLIMNLAWTPVFFIGSFYLAAFILLLAIFITVVAMTWMFMRIDKIAGYLQIPYIVWLCIAAYLSCSVVLLN